MGHGITQRMFLPISMQPHSHGFVEQMDYGWIVDQPNFIVLYNKEIGGVDRLNQNLAAYMIIIRN